MNRGRRLPVAAAAIALLLTATGLRLARCTDTPFVSDAADYVVALRRGFWTLYTAADSMDAASFVRACRSDAAFRDHPWRELRTRGDGAAVRHFHVPASFYLPSLADRAGAGAMGQRILMTLLASLTIVAAFLMLAALGVDLALAFLAGLALSSSPALIATGTELSPHPQFSLAALCAVFCFWRWLGGRSRKWLAGFLGALAISIATLELSPVLIAGLAAGLISWWWWRVRGARAPFITAGELVASAIGLFALLFALWPAGILKGGYLLSYGTFVYQALFRGASYFPDRGLASSIRHLGDGSAAAGVAYLLLLAPAVYCAVRNRTNTMYTLFTSFALLLVAQGLGNGFHNMTYASHTILAIVFAACLSLEWLLARGGPAHRWTANIATAVLACVTIAQVCAGV